MNETKPKPKPVATIRLCSKCKRRLCDAYLEGNSVVILVCKRCNAVNELKAA